jgi:hypothetical protein
MIYITGIKNLNIEGFLGRGIDIGSRTYFTNDMSLLKKKVLSPNFRLSMGHLEYVSLIEGTAAAYWRDIPNEPDPSRACQMLITWLQCLRSFFMALWLVRDNAVNCEMGFVEHQVPAQGLTYGSNYISAQFNLCNGNIASTKFSADEIRFARSYFQDFFLPVLFNRSPGSDFAKIGPANQQKLLISSKAIHRLTRLVYFLSGARCSSDLGVKLSLYMTCFEILFATDSNELTHRLAQRVAIYLYEKAGERLAAYQLIKRAYNVRSKVVHGDVLKDGVLSDLVNVSKEIDELLRTVVRRLVSDDSTRSLFDSENDVLDKFFTKLTLGGNLTES